MPGMRVDHDVEVPMRDGVLLRADVYRPEGNDAVPALLNRTPYDRSVAMIPPAGIEPEPAVAAGFAVVCQDVRGQYGSDGEFYTFVDEATDGYDTVEWVAAQPWCDGAVGMVGRSYGATCQWLAASERPPHLKAICPIVTGSDFFRGWVYQGGAFQLGFNLFWVWMMSDRRGAAKAEELFRHLPLRSVPLPDPQWARFYFDWLDHPTDDDYWQSLSINHRYPRIEVPALSVGGWFDVFLGGTLENFVRMRREGGSDAARAGQRLLVGPWAHGSTYGPFPDHGFDVFERRDAIDFLDVQLRFFERHLRGVDGAGEDEPPVRLFVMGENRWRDEDAWPLARARETPWFLRAGGRLEAEGPGPEPPDEYTYDPNDPAPTVGGATSLPTRMMKSNAGPLDQARVEKRDDVLVYTSPPLDRALEVTGPVALVLHAATSGRDTDFVAKLTDVWPDGTSLILTEGVLRARFRAGFSEEVPVEPERPYEYRIDLVATSNVFLNGHRIRLVVTSSSFPRFDRNANTGSPLGTDAQDDLRPTRQTVFHDGGRPSRLLLPVVPR
jgi:putative CocE/NonD family hydrolase